jgi:predicted unusual protein kinase regulating ubiquinone biosynthesis (AarF/ABC1/UbiB family)
MSFSGYESGPEGEVRIDQARYRRITFFFARTIAHLVWWDILLKQVMSGRVLASRAERWRTLARQFRHLAVEMGGVLIKLGQFLSTRVDVLPPEITDELRGLQDEVPPVDTEAILAVVEEELGELSERFREIESQPMAAASLGQVHRAWLRPDEAQRDGAVVIKVQRPGIVQRVQTDLAALRVVARWVMYYPPIRRRADAPALMEEFARTMWEELDYEQEADNAERFAEMFAGDEGVYIPSVYRRHSTGRVLVLENVEALKITDVAGIEAAGISSQEVAARLLDVYFKQVFEEGFFHADPHPGNLFVEPCAQAVRETEEEEAQSHPFRLTFVDFGMVGRIPSLTGESLRKVLFSVTQRDARALTEAYQELGFFLPGADLERIAEAQEVLLQELWGRNLLEMTRPDPQEVQELTKEFRDILFDFPFQVPHDFIYLGRAIGMLSGLASTLDPQINPWYQIEAYGMALLRRRETQQAGLESVIETAKLLVQLPLQVQRVLTSAEQGRLRVEARPDRQTVRQLERIERKMTQLQVAIVGATGVLSAVLLYLFRRRD